MRELKQAEQDKQKRRRRTMRRGLIGLVVVGAVLALVFGLAGPSGNTTKSASKLTTPKNGSTSSVSKGSKGSTTTTAVTAAAPTCPPATAAGAAKRVTAFKAAPPDCIPKNGVYDATVKTDVGTFVVEMHAAASYAAVNNFVFLARYHFFDGTPFQRVIKGFVVQGGSPNGTSSGGPGYSFTGNTPPASCKAKKDCYPVGGLAMANSTGPSTNGSQFFIVLPGGQSILDTEPNYTLFGQVVKGMSVVERIGADGAPQSSSTGTPKVEHHIETVTISKVG